MKRLASLPAFALVLAATGNAHAIELYASTPGTVSYPTTVIVTQPVEVPTTVIEYHPTFAIAPTETTVTTDTDAPSHPQLAEQHDPATSVFLGGGYGGMTAFHGAASTYRLHAGLGLGSTEIGLRTDLSDRALGTLANESGSVWMLSAEVAHRFLPGATVRPVLAASFDRWQVSPDGHDASSALGLGVRGGIEVYCQLTGSAALVLGADVAYHRLLESVDDAAMASDVLTFGATADIRL